MQPRSTEQQSQLVTNRSENGKPRVESSSEAAHPGIDLWFWRGWWWYVVLLPAWPTQRGTGTLVQKLTWDVNLRCKWASTRIVWAQQMAHPMWTTYGWAGSWWFHHGQWCFICDLAMVQLLPRMNVEGFCGRTCVCPSLHTNSEGKTMCFLVPPWVQTSIQSLILWKYP